MRITGVEVIELQIPFDAGGGGEGLFPTAWNSFDFALLKLTTDSGHVGWGDAFAYHCRAAVAAMLRQTVAPALIGADPRAPGPIMAGLQQAAHIIGRYGVTMFALSAADIALHDLAAKTSGASLADWLGGRRRGDVPAYASLIRYGDAGLVREVAARAAAEGHPMIKLHEIEMAPIEAGRIGAGDRLLTNDVNCNWTEAQTMDWAGALRELDLLWLEEPIFPPEDFAALARLRAATGLAIATGENLCTEHQFAALIAAGGADYAQPSLTKIGGVAETMATRRRAAAAGVAVAHHAPYFGPGALATLQILAAAEGEEMFEYLYVDRAACLYGDALIPKDGRIAIPAGPGLGVDPDPGVIAAYSV